MARTIRVIAALLALMRHYLWSKDTLLDAVFNESKKLGGVYIKFLQQLATSEYAANNPHSLASNFDVFDRVAAEPLNIEDVLIAEFGTKAGEFHILNNSLPIASGSFAQVYLAHHKEYGNVIIKALRPSVVENLNVDLRLLRLLAYVVQLGVPNDLINAPQLAKEFIRATRRETDYLAEAEQANYLRSYFEQRRAPLYIPRTYEQYTTKRVLAQEYIDGVKLSDVIVREKTHGDAKQLVKRELGSNLHKQLENLGAELLGSIFFADYIMADPHPGNVILLPDDRIALIDFGLVASAPARRSIFYGMVREYRRLYENMSDLSTFTMAMMAFYDYELYDALKTHMQSLGSNVQSLRDTIARVAVPDDIYVSQNFAQYRWTSLIMQDINTNNQLGIKVSPQHIVLQKAMRSYITSVRLACSSIDNYNDVLYKSLVRAEEEARQRGVKEISANQSAISLEEAREITVDWLSKLAERNEIMFKSLAREFQV